MNQYPFDVMQVINLLHLQIRHENTISIDTDCPFCGKKAKLNFHKQRQVFRCNYCPASGNLITLYANLFHVSNQEAYHAICKLVCCGQQAQGYQIRVQETEKKQVAEAVPIADIQIRHQTYSKLLELLFLSVEHTNDLARRGLTVKQAYEAGYRSVPIHKGCKIAEQLLKAGCQLKGIPGFFQNEYGQWMMAMNQWMEGYFVPVCDIQGRIQAMQIRLDNITENGAKYIWFSSIGYKNGCSAGSPIHIAGSLNDRTVYVTEGALKAQIAHTLTGHTFIASAGVNQYKSFVYVMKEFKKHGVKQMIECFDMDKFQNIHVMRGSIIFCLLAQQFGFLTKNLVWNPNYKGIDDLNLALHTGQLFDAGYGYYHILNAAKEMHYKMQDFVEMYDLSIKYSA